RWSRSVRSDSARARQPEHAFREDVPLYLGRAREDRCGPIVQPRAHEPSTGDRMWPRLPAEPRRAEDVHERVVDALAHLAPEQLHEARLGPERLLAPDPRQRPPIVELRDLDLDPVLRQPLPDARVTRRRRALADTLAREPEQVVEQHAVDDELARRRPALVRERRIRDLPAVVL